MTPQEDDGRREAAKRLFAEGERLEADRTDESRDASLLKFQEALALYRAASDRPGELKTLIQLGAIHLSAGEYRRALDLFTPGLQIARELGSRRDEGILLNNSAVARDNLGEKGAAQDLFESAITAYLEAGEKAGEATALVNLGALYRRQGEYRKALDCLTHGVELWRALGAPASEAIALDNLALTHESAGEPTLALEAYERTLGLKRAAGDTSGQAYTLLSLGRVHQGLYDRRAALRYHAETLPLWDALGDRAMKALVLDRMGSLSAELGETEEAVGLFERALEIERETGERAGEANTLNHLATLYNTLGRWREALDLYSHALRIMRELGNKAGEGGTSANVGSILNVLGKRQEALELFTRALALKREAGDREGEAIILGKIGLLYSSLGETQKALDYLNESLSLRRELGGEEGEAVALSSLGAAYHSLGDNRQALEYYRQALRLKQVVGNPASLATTLNNMGSVYESVGQTQEALDCYNRALELHRQAGDRVGEASTLANIGTLYISLGDGEKGAGFYLKAFPVFKEAGDTQSAATMLNNVASVLESSGSKEAAIAAFEKSLSLSRSLGDRRGEATTLANMGRLYYSTGDPDAALESLRGSVAIRESIGDRFGMAPALNSLGFIQKERGQYAAAVAAYEGALSTYELVREPRGMAITLSGLAAVERARGDLDAARGLMRRALDVIESVRVNIYISDLRIAYFATVRSYYEFYIDLLLELHQQRPSEGHDTAALEVSEQARARVLIELLAESKADLRRDAPRPLLERELSLRRMLNAKARQQINVLSNPHTEQEAAKVAREIEDLVFESQQVEMQIRRASPHYASLARPRPITLNEVQGLLDDETFLLEYSLGKERSFVWAVTRDSAACFTLPPRKEVEEAAMDVYWLLSARSRTFAGETAAQRQARGARADAQLPAASLRLSRMILAPVAAYLSLKRIVVVSDGALQFLPFASLPEPAAGEGGAPPLILGHEVVSMPSASTLAAVRRERNERRTPEKTVVVLADPVFDADDERVVRGRSRAAEATAAPAPADASGLPPLVESAWRESDADGLRPRIPRLPGSRSEAEQILSLVAGPEGRLISDFEANRATVLSGELTRYRYVHFATHGILNSAHPLLSGVVLSTVDKDGNLLDGFLRAHEIFGLELSAELVVLSACQTGLGKQAEGEGLVSMARGFIYAGAPRVVVSLWNIDDAATAELMASFYRNMLVDGLGPSTALRSAQLSMLKQTKWRPPFFWSAFVLQGEWR